jgi:hypothetical protein
MIFYGVYALIYCLRNIWTYYFYKQWLVFKNKLKTFICNIEWKYIFINIFKYN